MHGVGILQQPASIPGKQSIVRGCLISAPGAIPNLVALKSQYYISIHFCHMSFRTSNISLLDTIALQEDIYLKAYSAASGSINILYVTGLAARAMVKSELKAA